MISRLLHIGRRVVIGAMMVFVAVCMNAKISATSVYVDKDGVMRNEKTGEEVSFFGTNYTAPFAFAYRAMEQTGIDHKKAIDRDVYHMARLGFNGFRLHLWDVELSDSIGNLVDNKHLDLLDYLISKLEERDIKIIITAQTNFGNGYPQPNSDPYGAFTYDYDKCRVHDDPAAIKAQERYITQLLGHKNRYTGRSFVDDPDVIALEVNNEPCHSGGEKVVKQYLSKMTDAIKKSGWKKPVLYNVSHNFDVTQAFYDSKIDGTTYQWYPLGLVGGFTRKGNFLPYVDQYHIPFADKVKGFDTKAKVVYEYDPADNLLSYLHPAIARTFRKEGFQWATQFAYDPIDIAWSNAEYQTHYLNLAYTPQKALSMMIAAEVMRNIERGADFGSYPNDTTFGDFMVSGRRDLSVMNDGEKFIYTNSNEIAPKNLATLSQIAGYGKSKVVDYAGTGAYFLDKLADGVWRLELMPDVVLTSDPFAKPSLDKRVARIYNREHPMRINLSDLGREFFVVGMNDGNNISQNAHDATIDILPGTYLLARKQDNLVNYKPNDSFGTMSIGEFVAPKPDDSKLVFVVHTPKETVTEGKPLVIEAIVASALPPDSVIIYPESVSMWNKHNRTFKMEEVSPYTYRAEIPVECMPEAGSQFGYDIVVAYDGGSRTFPQDAAGTPIDWDFIAKNGAFRTRIVEENAPIVLVDPSNGFDNLEISTIPPRWGSAMAKPLKRSPIAKDAIRINLKEESDSLKVVLVKYVAEALKDREVSPESELVLRIDDVNGTGLERATLGIVTADGIAYASDVELHDGELRIPLKSLRLSPTYLCPEPFPAFLGREFMPEDGFPAQYSGEPIEKLQIMIPKASGANGIIEISGVYLK